MSSLKRHFNSLLILAGFILMAGGGAHLVRSEERPEQTSPPQAPEPATDFIPQPALYIPIFPIPIVASDPEGTSGSQIAPEAAAPEAPEAINPNYDGELERYATGNMLRFIEGPFGALIMVCAGIGAIIAGAFGGYKIAISLLFVAVGAFILRALVSLFFGGGFQATDVGDFVGGTGGL